MADHDRSKPIWIAFARDSFLRSSSFVRSKIRMFASIARPIERMRPAIEERVRTIQKSFTILMVRIV